MFSYVLLFCFFLFHVLFIQLDCFQLGANVDKAAMNLHVQVFVWIYACIPLR